MFFGRLVSVAAQLSGNGALGSPQSPRNGSTAGTVELHGHERAALFGAQLRVLLTHRLLSLPSDALELRDRRHFRPFFTRIPADPPSRQIGCKFLAGSHSALSRRIARLDGDTVWVASESELHANKDGKPMTLFSTETMVLNNTPVGRKIVHIHWSSRPKK